jgi:tetratricopeptide (TPR) repeat protein
MRHNSITSAPLRHAAAAVMALALSCAIAWAQAATEDSSPWNAPAFSLSPAEAIAAAAELKGSEGDDAVFALESESYSFQPDGTAVYTCRAVYKLLLKKGVDQRDTVSCSYQPWRQEKPSIRARVIGKDGTVYDLDQATVADQSQSEEEDVYTDSHTLSAPLPGLDNGAIVEYEIHLRDKAPLLAAGDAYRSWFGRRVAILDRKLSLDYPASMNLRYELRGSLASRIKANAAEDGTTGRKTLTLEAKDLESVGDTEDYLAGSDVPQTCVDFSTGGSWNEVAAAYAAVAEPVLAKSNVMHYASEALKSAGAARADRIAAILYKIRKEIRYTGINFGENAIIPHDSADTIARGYGDCKDQASLLASCLRTAGIKAQLALLDSGYGSDILPSLPGFGLFNHEIVYLPEDKTWIDPTASYYRPGELPPMDRGRQALVIAPDTTALLAIPDSKPEDNHYKEVRAYNLAETGAAAVTETMTATGSIEADYRYRFATDDPKSARERLESYVKSAYQAEKLESYSFSDVQDMQKPFTLSIVASKAKRGFTDQSSATVILQAGALLNFLPSFLKEKPKDDKAFERKADVKLDEPYIAEIEYRLTPPPGFKAAALPEPTKRSLGPATVESFCKLEEDGSVTATFRFDSVKSTYTAVEAIALQAAAVAFGEEDAPSVSFEEIGESLLSAGKYQEALDEFRRLAALHPTEALHHMQLSNAYEAALFCDEARAEARKAVELEPDSAAAHARLAWTYLIGPFARVFEPGSDLAAASSEYAAAAKLAPDEMLYTVNQAIIAEYGTNLIRYSKGARLDDALAIYAKIEKELKGSNWENNPAYDLLRLGRFKELKESTKAPTNSKQRKALFVAAVAAVDGVQVALREAARVAQAADDKREILSLASQMLITGRRYAEAAELMIAGARGSQSQTQALALAESLKTVKAIDPAALPKDEPMSAIVSSLDDPDSQRDITEAIASAGARLSGDNQPAAVTIDLVAGLGKIDTIESGSAIATLLSFPLQPSLQPILIYFTREGDELKALGSGGNLTGVAREIARLLDSGKTEDARAWLSLIKSQRDKNPLFPSFADQPVFKLVGEIDTADESAMRLAASYLLVVSASKTDIGKGMPAVLAALGLEKDKDKEKALAQAAVMGLIRQNKAAEAVVPAERLIELEGDDEYANDMLLLCLDCSGKEATADAIVVGALEKKPNSESWLRLAAEHSARLGRYAEAVQRSEALIDSGNAKDGDYNQMAWYSLYLDKPDYAELDKRHIVQRLMAGSAGQVHTLACVLSDSGRFMEAQEAFRKFLAESGNGEPNSDAWLAFGLYTERFGLIDTAIDAYRKVKPENDLFSKDLTSYDLAQIHLKRLNKQ